MVAKFDLGARFITPAIREQIPAATIRHFFRRHASGDFGDICEEDAAVNLAAITARGRVLSAYGHAERAVYVITEPGDNSTTVLFAYEYSAPPTLDLDLELDLERPCEPSTPHLDEAQP